MGGAQEKFSRSFFQCLSRALLLDAATSAPKYLFCHRTSKQKRIWGVSLHHGWGHLEWGCGASGAQVWLVPTHKDDLPMNLVHTVLCSVIRVTPLATSQEALGVEEKYGHNKSRRNEILRHMFIEFPCNLWTCLHIIHHTRSLPRLPKCMTQWLG